MKNLLITGASGFLGWHLGQIAQTRWKVYGTYFTHSSASRDINLSQCDLTDFQALKDLFSRIEPDAVIHTAAQSKPNFCQDYPQESSRINVTASLNIASLCADRQIPCVLTSTDLVFDGLNSPYSETDPVSPINYYGEQKVKAEQGMLERYPRTAICRMPLMFGNASPTASSFMQSFLQTLIDGGELTLFTDEYRTPVSATTVAKGLLLALENSNGILHLGGRERLSRYQFGQILAEVFNLPTDRIKPCLQKDVLMSAPRPTDVSLESSKAFSLGYNPLSIKEELKILLSQHLKNRNFS